MRIEIRNLPEVQALLQNLSEKELRYATIVGTNRTAYAVMLAQRDEVEATFLGPTRFIQTGIRYEKMTTTRPYARAYWTDERNPYIEPHVIGGERSLKKMEKAYRDRGIIGGSQWLVPGDGAPRDKFGNPTRAFYDKLYNATNSLAMKKKYGAWFVKPGKGIFERRGGTIVPLMFFTRAPQYKPRYEFYETAISEANRVAIQLMSESVAKAIARSRG